MLLIIRYLDCILPDTTYSGGLIIQTLTYNNRQLCIDNCRDNPKCNVWTWKQDLKQCVTKDEQQVSKDSEVDSVSGPKGCYAGMLVYRLKNLA